MDQPAIVSMLVYRPALVSVSLPCQKWSHAFMLRLSTYNSRLIGGKKFLVWLPQVSNHLSRGCKSMLITGMGLPIDLSSCLANLTRLISACISSRIYWIKESVLLLWSSSKKTSTSSMFPHQVWLWSFVVKAMVANISSASWLLVMAHSLQYILPSRPGSIRHVYSSPGTLVL